MPRRSGRNRSKGPPFVAVTWDMLNGKAYQQLPPMAAKMLPYFLGKVHVEGSLNNPARYSITFSLTYTEANRYGCARRTFFEVIKALVHSGFIDPVEKGGLRGNGLTSSVFKLSDRWRVYGTSAFNDVKWECFGEHQIRRQVQNLPHTVAKNELERRG